MNYLFPILTLLFLISNQIYSQSQNEKLSTSINGTIIMSEVNTDYNRMSANGNYGCTYNIGSVTDEQREIHDFKFFENRVMKFSLAEIPGSDVEITNAGYLIFYDHSKHYEGKLILHIYSNSGTHLFSKSFSNADQFETSENGKPIGVLDQHNLHVIDIENSQTIKYDRCEKFSMDRDGKTIVVLNNHVMNVYKEGLFVASIKVNIDFIRKIKISSELNLAVIINKRNLIAFNISDGEKIFSNSVNDDLSFRDLKISNSKIVAGLHKRNKTESTGILREYTLDGKLLNQSFGNTKPLIVHKKNILPKKNSYGYESIPWPFMPFDSMHTVWNHYEQHMGNGGGSWSYLHQGLDLIVPTGERTYSVTEGIVKLMLTLGGAAYWRIAVSDTNIAEYSDGWLYAHLIENTIQFDIGDTVHVHDYLGDIIQWSEDWGHIHFVEIRDSGFVWSYGPDQWGINFNPLLALTPYTDSIDPVIENVFPDSKFGFCENETSNYLNADSLFGKIDIICKVVDYVGESDWQQPAFKTFFWIINSATGDTIQIKKLGHILDHKYPFYGGDYYTPFAEVMYKRDDILTATSWMDKERNYYHIVTNSNGDSLVSLNEKDIAFNTADFQDGHYKIFIQVFDEAGNSAIDSVSVQFKNGNVTGVKSQNLAYNFSLNQNYPNPFNPTTTIKYSIPEFSFITLKIYDLLGREVHTIVSEKKAAGNYEVTFDAGQLSSGIYFYQLRSAENFEIRKMVLVK